MTTQTTGIAGPAATVRRPGAPLTDGTVGRVEAWQRAADHRSDDHRRTVDTRVRARGHTREHGEDITEPRDPARPDVRATGTGGVGRARSGRTAGAIATATATGGDDE